MKTGDENSINTEIEALIRDNGFKPVRMGSLDQSIHIEVFDDLYGFGTLGKTITVSKAKKVFV